jgi:hypothetical protein
VDGLWVTTLTLGHMDRAADTELEGGTGACTEVWSGCPGQPNRWVKTTVSQILPRFPVVHSRRAHPALSTIRGKAKTSHTPGSVSHISKNSLRCTLEFVSCLLLFSVPFPTP